MDLLLIRHGLAVEDAPGIGDAGRWLSAKGRKITRRVGRWLAKSKKRQPATIWTSPLVRAVQTAEILAAKVRFKGEVKPCAELSPGRDPGDLVKLLGSETLEGPLVLVGHEPSLSVLAAALLGDVALGGFRKSGVVGIRWEEGKGTFLFSLDPADMKKVRHIEPGVRGAESTPPLNAPGA